MTKTMPSISLTEQRIASRDDQRFNTSHESYIRQTQIQTQINEDLHKIENDKTCIIKNKVHEMIDEIELLLNLSAKNLSNSEICECVVKFNHVMNEKLNQTIV